MVVDLVVSRSCDFGATLLGFRGDIYNEQWGTEHGELRVRGGTLFAWRPRCPPFRPPYLCVPSARI